MQKFCTFLGALFLHSYRSALLYECFNPLITILSLYHYVGSITFVGRRPSGVLLVAVEDDSVGHQLYNCEQFGKRGA